MLMRKTNALFPTVVTRSFFLFFFAVVSIAAAAADYYVKFQLFPIAQNAQRAYKRRCDYAAFGSGVTSYRKRQSLKMKISRKII